MALSLRQVRYFIAVAENGSVTGAAQQLSVSQSTVTEAIKGLEDELGVRLIERQARGVALSYKCQQFLRTPHHIPAEVHDDRHSLPLREPPQAGTLQQTGMWPWRAKVWTVVYITVDAQPFKTKNTTKQK